MKNVERLSITMNRDMIEYVDEKVREANNLVQAQIILNPNLGVRLKKYTRSSMIACCLNNFIDDVIEDEKKCYQNALANKIAYHENELRKLKLEK